MNIPLAKPKAFEFNFLTSEDVDEIAVETLTNTSNRKQMPGTVLDAKLGPCTSNYFCNVDGSDIDKCSGHHGKFDLFQPCINVFTIAILQKILHCICIRCSRLLFSYSQLNKIKSLSSDTFKKKVNELYNLTLRNRVCWFDDNNTNGKQRLLSNREYEKYGYCGFRQPDVWLKDEKIMLRPCYYIDNRLDALRLPVITPLHMFEILRNVDKDTCELFGFASSLHCLFYYSFPVPPMIIRLSRTTTSEHDMTKTLRDIQIANNNADKTVIPNLTSGLLKTIEQQKNSNHKIKTNVIKNEMERIEMGKLSTKYTRKKIGVIPECLDFYFDVQRHVSRILDSNSRTKLDVDYGRDRLSLRQTYTANASHQGRVRNSVNGKRIDDSGRLVITPDDYQEVNGFGLPEQCAMKLTIKEVVNIYNYHTLLQAVKNGPLKHPGCNFIERGNEKFLPNANITLKLGDKVLRHVRNGDIMLVNRQPSLHRYAIMAYKLNIHKDNTGKLHLAVMKIIGGDFDGDAVTFMLPHDLESMAEAFCLMNVSENLFKDGKLVIGFVQHAALGAYKLTTTSKLFTHQELFQLLMQGNNVDLALDTLRNNGCNKSIYTGREVMHLLMPTYDLKEYMTASLLNTCMFKRMQQSFNDDNNENIKIIGFVTRILEHYCIQQGVSLTLKDYMHNETDIPQHVRDKAAELKNSANQLSLKETRLIDEENAIIKYLSRARDILGEAIIEHLKKRKYPCGLLDITLSGAKGTLTTITQSSQDGCVGLQLNGLSHRNHLALNHSIDSHIEKFGYVDHSFYDGLTAYEFYLHLISTRIGFIGTSIHTADTGYMYRRLWKFVEDYRIAYKNTVRDAYGEMIMFSYGFDTNMLFLEPLHTPKLTIKDVIHKYFIDDNVYELEKLLYLRSRVLMLKNVPNDVAIPMNLKIFKTFDTTNNSDCSISAKECFQAINALWIRLVLDFDMPNSEVHELSFFELYSSKNLYQMNALTCQENFKHVIETIFLRYSKSVCEVGTPVGLRSSQGTTEPLNQMNLKSSHISGESRPLVGGVVRLKEIFNCNENIQTPCMFICINKEYEDVFDPLNMLLELYLNSILVSWSDKPVVANHMQLVSNVNNNFDPNDQDVVIVTLFLNKMQMMRRKLPPRRVADKLIFSKTLSRDLINVAFTYSSHLESIWYITVTVKRNSKIFNSNSLDDPLPLLASQLHHTLKYEKSLLNGIKDIHDYCKTKKKIQTKDLVTGHIITEERVVYETCGSNLLQVCLLSPYIDLQHTTTNDICQIYNVFGIDATLHAIETNLYDTMVASNAPISAKHLNLIAHCMTQSGKPIALNYAGMNSKKNIPYLKLSTFERSVDSFVGAAISGTKDDLRGMSESIFAGTKMSLGTGGDFKLLNHNDNKVPLNKNKTLEHIVQRTSLLKIDVENLDVIFNELNLQDPIVLTTQTKEEILKTTKRKHNEDPFKWGTFPTSKFIPTSPKKKPIQKQPEEWQIFDFKTPSSP